MVVGQADEVEACLLEEVGVGRGHAEGVGVLAGTFGTAYLLIAEDSFAVAHGDVGRDENLLYVVEEVLAVVGGQLGLRMEGAEHHVAHHGDGVEIVGNLHIHRRHLEQARRHHPLAVDETAGTDIAFGIVGFFRRGDADTGAGGVDEIEGAVGFHGGDNTHMADGLAAASAAVEHQICRLELIFLHLDTHLVLRCRRRSQRHVEFAIDIAGEASTVESLGGLATPLIRHADVFLGFVDDGVGGDGVEFLRLQFHTTH